VADNKLVILLAGYQLIGFGVLQMPFQALAGLY
jgi:hypothetical protein